MDIIYFLINDVKIFNNYPYISLIVYICSMVLLAITSVVLILLIYILVNKLVSLFSVFINKCILKTTGGPDPNSDGGASTNSNPGGGSGPNPGGGPGPN